jgi:hypothetical protein
LHKHGWYKRKGIDGDPHGYTIFFIQRLLCTTVRRTISLIPVFVHTYKRYALSFVINCLSSNIEDKDPLQRIAQQHGLHPRTLQRWKQSFSEDQVAKHSCLLPGQQVAWFQSFAGALLSHFRTLYGNLFEGSVKAMTLLWSKLTCALY